MMIKTRLSTIIEDSWTSIYNYENLLHFCVNIFYSKMFVKWSRFYVITCFNASMLSRSLIAQLAFFGVFNWNIKGSNSFSPIITIKSIGRKKVHSMFGTHLCNGWAHKWCAYKGKDGFSSKRSRGRNINGQVMPGLTMNPSFLGE